MSDIITIRLAGLPKGKGRPRFVRATGAAFTPAATRSYESHLRMAAQDVMGGRAPVEGALKVCVFASFPIPASWPKKRRQAALAGTARPTSKPDADNLLKILDALNQVVWRDDSQIVDGFVRKLYSETPELVVTVEVISEPAAVSAPQPTLFAEAAE